MNRTLIAELPQKVGSRSRVRGWVQALRDQKRVQFVVLRDETGLAQVVLGKDEPPSELNERGLGADRRVGRHRHRRRSSPTSASTSAASR